MSPYWDNKALPTPTLALTVLYLQRVFLFYFIIENKCLSDAIWDLKREKKVCQKVNHVKISTTHFLPSVPLEQGASLL